MRKIILFIAIAMATSTSYSQVQLVDDLNAEVRNLEGSYNRIVVAGGIDVYLTQSASEGIAISASEQKFKDAIKTEVKNNTLKVYFDGERSWGFRTKNLRAYISFKNIELLDVSGASDVVVAGSLASPNLTMRFSGASDFTGAVEVENLDLNLSGASDIKISGNATVLTINSSGASDINGFALNANVCRASASGASDINISVINELTAEASGSSEIRYRGSPAIKGSNKSGSSSIKKG